MFTLLRRNGVSFVRGSLRTTGIALYHCGLANWIINLNRKRVRAVLYHAVESQQSDYTNGLNVTVPPETFALHLDYYQRHYNVISTRELLADGSKPASLLISFDDGYASVMDEALPLLEQRNMPAVVYLIGCAVRGRMVWVNRLNQAMNSYPCETRQILSAYPGLENMHRSKLIHHVQTRLDPTQIKEITEQLEIAIPELANDTHRLFCTRDDILEMQKRGIEFGFHTNDHMNLGKCRDSELQAQLETCGLESLINSNTFAYPFGYYAPAAIAKLSRAGFDKLLTVGNNTHYHSELHLDRTEVFETSYAKLFARLEVEEPVVAAMGRLANGVKQLRRKQLKQQAPVDPTPQKSHL
ncbi:MAG: polysaccharide deacetylase family protein [Granulosicoccus sp.]|nr:polysaccharide deacetylase family protein [Granulosicoccus sp.]